MARLTQRELRAARKLGAALGQLMAADTVFAILPDGKQMLVKGRDRLDRIIASGISEKSLVSYVPVLSAESAAALEQQLGGDGVFARPEIVGHA